METIYEACGYRVVPGKRTVFGDTYDILRPDGKKLTSVGSEQGYKRVIRKAAGINACAGCGCLPSGHRAAIAPTTVSKPKDEHAVRVWQYCNQRARMSKERTMRYFWSGVSARVHREQFVEVRHPGIPAACFKHKDCPLSPSQVAASIRERERAMSK